MTPFLQYPENAPPDFQTIINQKRNLILFTQF